jgi:hypothetical protein
MIPCGFSPYWAVPTQPSREMMVAHVPKQGLLPRPSGLVLSGSASHCEVIMPRTLRLTCARTTYFELEIAADDGARPEDVLTAAIAANAALCEQGAVGRPVYRIVEVAGAQEGEISSDPHARAA